MKQTEVKVSESTATKPRRGIMAKAVYHLILPFYVVAESSVPMKEKAKIFGAFAYFFLPVDLIPDVLPVLGFTDDLTVLVLLWRVLRKNINTNEKIRTRAWARVDRWFPPKK